MNLCEWKENQSQKVLPQYTHFDRRVSLDKCFEYITSPDKVAHHGFYPFIHYTIKSRKVKDGKKDKSKKRQIYYAAHIDGWIYRYYAYLINDAYNQRVKKDGIDSVAVAYRTNLRKSNIDFAKEAFQHIRDTTSCYVMIGDFTDFFDSLDHVYLKKQLCDLLSVEKLPDDLYAVYKNVTRFSYVELHDLLVLNGLEDTPKGRKEFNNRSHERALSPEEFRQNKNIVYFGNVTEELPKADIYIIGSWTDKGNATNDIIEVLKKIKNKKIAYFGTAGYGGSEEYYKKLFEKVRINIDSSNEILGYFYCQGKMPIQVRERYEKMITQNPENTNLKVSIENFDKALSHPDSEDINNVKKWVKCKILSKK